MREIEQEAYAEPETEQQKDTKQTAAVGLSKSLKSFRSINDASSLKGNTPCPLLTKFHLPLHIICASHDSYVE